MLTAQVGYVITGIKVTRSARVGDTWHLHKRPVERLPGFKPSKSMVFAGARSQRAMQIAKKLLLLLVL